MAVILDRHATSTAHDKRPQSACVLGVPQWRYTKGDCSKQKVMDEINCLLSLAEDTCLQISTATAYNVVPRYGMFELLKSYTSFITTSLQPS